jgi:hypothetical protein
MTVNQPNADAAFHPPPSASDIPDCMLNESFTSHTLVANRGTKEMTGTSNSTISVSFRFHLCSSNPITSIMSASIDHPKALSTKTETSPLSPKTTPFAISSKISQALTSLFYHLPSFHNGWQVIDVLFTSIKG